MKAIVFQGEIKSDTVAELCRRIDEVPQEETVVLYFTSGGGSYSDMEILADYLNKQAERFEFVGVWDLSSSAFDLLRRLKCRRRVFDDTFSRLHLLSRDLDYRDLQDSRSYETFLLKRLERDKEDLLGFLKTHGFDEEELARVAHGDGVVIGAERIRAVTGCE